MRCEPPGWHLSPTPGAPECGQGPRAPLGGPGGVGRSAVGRWRVVAAPAPLHCGRRPGRPAGLAGHPQVRPAPGPGGRRRVRPGGAGLAASSPLVIHPADRLAGSGGVAGCDGLPVPVAAGDGHHRPGDPGLGHRVPSQGRGIAQYMIVTAAALGILTTLVSAADAAARGILAAGLNAHSWQGISAANAPWQNAVHGVSGAGLGLIALLGVLPAAIGLVVAALVRQASILVIAATIPILAAGLVAEATARWFWTGLRWMFALIMLTPAVAIVISIG